MLWRSSGASVGRGWCQAEAPAANWSLFDRGCAPGLRVKVLTYNLFWWNLFGVRGGNGGSAGALIAASQAQEPFDILAFQECQDVYRVLGDAGLRGSYTGLQLSDGDIALGLAYRTSRWTQLSRGAEHVAEDRPEQFYGQRGVQWVRLQESASVWGPGRVVFFLNHHGPLPVDTGGTCGGAATAYNLLRILGKHAQVGDLLILVGDFNAGGGSQTQATLREHMYRLVSSWVDAVYSSCAGGAVRSAKLLGTGGSDHRALEAVLEL